MEWCLCLPKVDRAGEGSPTKILILHMHAFCILNNKQHTFLLCKYSELQLLQEKASRWPELPPPFLHTVAKSVIKNWMVGRPGSEARLYTALTRGMDADLLTWEWDCCKWCYLWISSVAGCICSIMNSLAVSFAG